MSRRFCIPSEGGASSPLVTGQGDTEKRVGNEMLQRRLL